MQRFQRIVTVENLDLAAALLTADARLDPGDELSHIVGEKNLRAFHFQERTEAGENVRDLVDIFLREPDPLKNDWRLKNPDHQFAVAWSAIHNRKWAHQVAADRTKTTLFRNGAAVCMIGGGLTKSQEDHLLQKIGV